MNLRSLAGLGIAAALLLGTACGGDDDNVDTAATNDTTEPTAAPAADGDKGGGGKGCQTLAKADIDAAFGVTFGEVEDTTTAGTTICNFEASDPPATFQYTIKPSSAGEYDATIEASKKRGATAKATSGVGDKAVVLTMENYGMKTTQVMAVKGSALFFTTAIHSGDPAKAEPASIELMKKLAAKL